MVEPILKGPKFTEATKSLKPPEAKPVKVGQPTEPAVRMSSFEVLRSVLGEELERGEMQQFMNALTLNMKKGVTKLIQLGNTVFIVNFITKDGKLMPPQTVEFYPISAEPEQLVNRLMVFPNTLKELGFKGAITYLDDPEELQQLQAAGVNMTVKQEMVFDGAEMSPMYRIEIRLS